MKQFLFFPRFFPNTIQKIMDEMNKKPLIYDVDGSQMQVCSHPSLHNFRGGMCVWCKKSLEELQSQSPEKSHSESPLLKPSLDLDSPTTATVNPPKPEATGQKVVEQVQDFKPQVMELDQVTCYCVKCKIKVPVLEPKYSEEETSRGTRRYLRGTCSICKTKICAIVKKEG